MKYLLIQAGCAECRWDSSKPLITKEGPFDTFDEAVEASEAPSGTKWLDHPEGGWFHGDGEGDDWILPIEVKE